MRLPAPLSIFLALTITITAGSAHGQVYKVVDESGRVTYTDKPPPSQQGERMRLPKINTQQGVEVPVKPAEEAQLPGPESAYSKLEIIQPRNGSSIPPGQLDLVIQVGIAPELQPNHLLSVILDGKPLGSPAAATSIRLDNLERGSHRIEAKVVDDQGRTIATSKAVSVYIHRASKLIKPKSSSGK